MPPTNLMDSLQGLRRRMKVFGIMYGAGLVVACAVGLLLAVVLLDWALALPTPLRLAVNVAALVVLGYAMYHWVAREAMKKMPLTDLAGRLEHRYPQFDDTLRSTVDFVQPTRGAIPGSEMMKQRTIAEAGRRAGQVNLNSAVVLRPVWYSAAAGIGALLLIASLVLLADKKFPDFLRIATNHLLGGGEPWPKRVEIDMIGHVPQRVAVGQHIDIKMRLKKGWEKTAVVKYRFDNGPWQNEVMDRAEDGTFDAGLDARIDGNKDLSKLQIRLVAGDDQRDINVDVVPRLDIKAVQALVTPPAYAQMPAMPVNIGERPMVTVIGSDIDLNITFNKPLDSSKGVRLEPVERGHAAPVVTWKFPGEGVAVAHFAADEKSFKPNDPFKFTIHAADTDGFENMGSQEYSVIVHDDSLPTVQIEEPRRPEDRTPVASVPLKAIAEDDYGIEVAQLVVNRLSGGPATRPATRPASAAPSTGSGQAPQQWIIELHNKQYNDPAVTWTPTDSSTERKRFEVDFAWDLAKLANANLKPGDQLEYYVQVKDNFNINGLEHPFVASNKMRLAIISQEHLQSDVETVLNGLKQQIEAIKKMQDLIRDDNATQSRETMEKHTFDDARRGTVTRLATQQSAAASQTEQAAQRLEDLLKDMNENKSPEKQTKETVDQVAKLLEQTSEGAMKDATSDLNKARETPSDPNATAAQQKPDAQNASESMDSAARNQGQASRELALAARKLEPYGGLEAAIATMQDLSKRQNALGEEYKRTMRDALGQDPDKLTSEQKSNIDNLTKVQDDLKRDTDNALNQLDAKADRMAKSDESASKAMKSAAQTGRQQGIPQKQRDSSQDMQQNQQANAQNDQKQAELGLEMILEQLTEAQRRQLEELGGKLTDLLQRLDELIARQSTHNLDNLILQDPSGKKIADLTDQDRKELYAWSRRDPKAPIKADLLVLARSQELTLTQCRDVAGKATALPDPAPSSKLTAAATKMEQAIVFLRKPQLADAYNPNQVEALKLLVDARKVIDEVKRKIDDDMQQRNEETIRAAYVKLLERQKTNDEQTRRINDAPRDNDGKLPLLLARLLPQLPGEQGKIADDANRLGEKLQSLGSVVYIWANRDIVNSMNEVKDDLARPSTGTITQAEQSRIEEQLEAMIRNLAQKKPEKPPFESPRDGRASNGGDGTPAPPQMPADVELRLLRDLQIAVNNATIKIAGDKDKDAQKLLALGGRQGEIRGILDQLLQKASKGQVKLGPEPKDTDKVPEEAGKDAVDAEELVKNLLDDNVSANDVTKKVQLTGDRMARSRRRMAVTQDPGPVTQEIQKRIVDGMDDLIKLAQKQQNRRGRNQPTPGEPGAPQPGDKGPQETAKGPQKGPNSQQTGQTPAQASAASHGSKPDAVPSGPLNEVRVNWGGLPPRERQAVMEGAGERMFPKYEKYLKDYYRELAKKTAPEH